MDMHGAGTTYVILVVRITGAVGCPVGLSNALGSLMIGCTQHGCLMVP